MSGPRFVHRMTDLSVDLGCSHFTTRRPGIPTLSTSLHRNIQLADTLSIWGSAYADLNWDARALSLCQEACNLVKRCTTSEEYRIYHQTSLVMGEILRPAGRYEEAATAFVEYLASIKKSGDPTLPTLLRLISALVAMGKWAEALEYGLEAGGALEREQHSPDDVSETFRLLADAFEGLGMEAECGRCSNIAAVAAEQEGRIYFLTEVSYMQRVAKRCMREGRYAEAEATKTRILKWYDKTMENGTLLTDLQVPTAIKMLRVVVEAQRAQGKEVEARPLGQDLDETEAILAARDGVALMELQEELQAEQTTAALLAGGAAGGDKNKRKQKPTRKQQKRKAAQRRKAEARAAAEAAEGDETKKAGDVAAVVAATAQLQIEQSEPEPEPGPEPEAEECAICLNDLPLPGEEDGGAVLLACSHTFHTSCLERWKDNCLEKGLQYTCAMCRGAMVIVAGAAGAGTGV